jgi:hypothetical protein
MKKVQQDIENIQQVGDTLFKAWRDFQPAYRDIIEGIKAKQAYNSGFIAGIEYKEFLLNRSKGVTDDGTTGTTENNEQAGTS